MLIKDTVKLRRLQFMKDRVRRANAEIAMTQPEAAHFNLQRQHVNSLTLHMGAMEINSSATSAHLRNIASHLNAALKAQPTLRDQFAMSALQGLLSDPNPFADAGDGVPAAYTESAYNYADAMLAERVK